MLMMWLLIIAGYTGSDIPPKFVVADRIDIEEAGRAAHEYLKAGLECPHLMPGGRLKNTINVLKEASKHLHGKGLEVYTPSLTPLSRNAWELNFKMPKRHYKNEQLDKAMKASTRS